MMPIDGTLVLMLFTTLAGFSFGIRVERERCAKIAEHLNGWGSDFGKGGHAMHIAAAIRRGE